MSLLVVSDKFRAVDLAIIAKSSVDNLTRLPIHIKGLITVSGYNKFYSGDRIMDSLNGSFYFDSQTLDLSSLARYIITFYGSDDPFIPQEYLSQFVEYIGGKAIVVPNAGHFNASSGYTKFEAILNELLKIEYQWL